MYAGPMAPREHPGTVREVLLVALRLGLTSFGGPVAHIGYFRRAYVEQRGWLDEAAFADLVALSQLLPGPASTQLGIAIGTRRAGLAGGIAAGAGFIAPSAVAMVVLGLVAAGTDLSGAGWVHGLKLAAVAVVAQAVIVMAGRLAPDARRRAITAAAAIATLLIATPLAQVGIIAAGAIAGRLWLPAPTEPAPTGATATVDRRVGAIALGTFVALLVALPLLRATGSHALAVVDSFYRSGALVFGGGHVVLPLLHANVVDPGWVSNDAFLAGYGAAQAVPGPLFTFAGYLGAVSTVPPDGVPGGVLALGAIFLPSFLLVFGALSVWDAVRAAGSVRRALSGTNAAVVGILLAALYTPVTTGAITGPADALVAIAGLGLLLTGRVPPIAVVALAALVGQAGIGAA